MTTRRDILRGLFSTSALVLAGSVPINAAMPLTIEAPGIRAWTCPTYVKTITVRMTGGGGGGGAIKSGDCP